MSYTGNAPAEQYISTVKDTFNGDGSTTDFTLSRTALANNLEVFVENVQQEPTTAYTVSGTTLSFTSAPVSGTGNIYVIHRGQAVQTIVPPAGISLNATDATITGAATIGDGITVDNDGATVATFDRATSDGDIIDLQKDGSTVGSIGVVNNNNPFIANDADNSGLQFGTNQIIPHYDSLQRDNAVDLGSSSVRFKDLYLSGGFYLGGTGSDNYLDDYEEGVWYPNTIAGSATASGYYVKIGRQVIVTCDIYAFTDQGTTSSVTVTGLPFAVTGMEHVGECMHRFISVGNDGMSAYTYSGQTTVLLYANNSGANWTNVHHSHLNSSSGFKFSLAYNTAQ